MIKAGNHRGDGVDAEGVSGLSVDAQHARNTRAGPFSSCEAFRRFVNLMGLQMVSTFSQREQKIVNAIYGLVEERGVAHLKIKELSGDLHLSTGHISRVFRRKVGMTLEEFLVRKRVELSKRTLLDPRLNVAEVAERCGFCNPAYFSSVFKKYVKCTPRQFASQPHPPEPLAAAPRGLR